MKYGDWFCIRHKWGLEYPTQPAHTKIIRLDIELSYPRNLISQVPVDNIKHNGYFNDELFYICHDWSTIFDVVPIDDSPHDSTLRMLVESGHQNPWGERMRLMSTSCSIVHESWADYKNWNDFAFFRENF